MAASVRPFPPLASRLAGELLKAWFTGDAARVHLELERSLTVPAGADDMGEQERRQLLRVVAKRMRHCPDLLEPCSQSPELSVCVRLLWHTAFGDGLRPPPD
jgi:hypothetical protein